MGATFEGDTLTLNKLPGVMLEILISTDLSTAASEFPTPSVALTSQWNFERLTPCKEMLAGGIILNNSSHGLNLSISQTRSLCEHTRNTAVRFKC